MKNLRLRRLHLVSDQEKAARIVQFDPRQTVILGENDTGKSCLIKSIYSAFGADPAKTNDSWTNVKASLLMDFSVDQNQYRILRSQSLFGLFDGNNNLLWSGTGVVSGLGPQLASLLDFQLTLQGRSGEQLTPPPAFCFLPFYVDQDVGWSNTWNSFAGLQMFGNYRRDVSYFHAGLRPNEYYLAKASKKDAERLKDALKIDLSALNRAGERLRSARPNVRFDISADAFADRIDALMTECRILRDKQDKAQRLMADLYSKRTVLQEQIDVAASTLAELDEDYEFMRAEMGSEVVCPTCGTTHSNDFANKFGLISDAETCRQFLFELQQEMKIIDSSISSEREKFREFDHSLKRINALLDEERGELKFRDLVESESERRVDDAILRERKDLEGKIGEQDIAIDTAAGKMKEFDDRKFQQTIKDRYFLQMKAFVADLNVPNLSEKAYKAIDCHIHETGSDLPRALLAYYYAFIHTMRAASSSALCPFVIDTPVQQDQDPENAARIISFILNSVPKDMQMILGTVSLHGVDYSGHVVKTTEKLRLLSKHSYEEAKDLINPLYMKILQASKSAAN